MADDEAQLSGIDLFLVAVNLPFWHCARIQGGMWLQ